MTLVIFDGPSNRAEVLDTLERSEQPRGVRVVDLELALEDCDREGSPVACCCLPQLLELPDARWVNVAPSFQGPPDVPEADLVTVQRWLQR